MSDQPTSDVQALTPITAQFRLTQPDFTDAPAVYANFAQATMGVHDLTLFLGWFATPPLVEQPDNVVPVSVRPLMAVSMPVEMAQNLIALLQTQLDLREQPSVSGPSDQVSDTPAEGEREP